MAYSKQEIEDIFNEICKRIENGESLNKIVKEKGTPASETVYKWIDSDEEKAKKYARATEKRAESIFEEIIQISDTPIEGVVIETDDNGRTKEKKGDMLGHRRLQIDARKWMLSKMMPKKYGDRVELEHSGEVKTDLSKLSTDELITRAEAVSKLKNNDKG